jgi:hypothetical protein
MEDLADREITCLESTNASDYKRSKLGLDPFAYESFRKDLAHVIGLRSDEPDLWVPYLKSNMDRSISSCPFPFYENSTGITSLSVQLQVGDLDGCLMKNETYSAPIFVEKITTLEESGMLEDKISSMIVSNPITQLGEKIIDSFLENENYRDLFEILQSNNANVENVEVGKITVYLPSNRIRYRTRINFCLRYQPFNDIFSAIAFLPILNSKLYADIPFINRLVPSYYIPNLSSKNRKIIHFIPDDVGGKRLRILNVPLGPLYCGLKNGRSVLNLNELVRAYDQHPHFLEDHSLIDHNQKVSILDIDFKIMKKDESFLEATKYSARVKRERFLENVTSLMGDVFEVSERKSSSQKYLNKSVSLHGFGKGEHS